MRERMGSECGNGVSRRKTNSKSKWSAVTVRGGAYNNWCLVVSLLLLSNNIAAADANANAIPMHTYTVQVSSFLPSQHPCSPSSSPSPIPKGRRQGISLEVKHRHGPCSTSNPSHIEILKQDEGRVESIRKQINRRFKPTEGTDVVDKMGYTTTTTTTNGAYVDLPAKSGSTIGTGNFVVTIGLGTPRKDLSLIFDTGSDFTWTQCEPCVKSCYKQKEGIFDPRSSSTYSNISCTSTLCSEVRSATSATPGCSLSTCMYGIQYGDSSFSVGFFAKDTLYLGDDDKPGFLFGCGQKNQGLFGESAGLLGLGRNKLSLVSQTSSKYDYYFSYCLPSKSTATGHLSFGRPASHGKMGTMMQYTPLLASSKGPSYYFIELEGISVGGQKLSISPSVFSAGGTLIDSGTVITRLPPDAYSVLQNSFTKLMSKYPKAPSLSILDTCYDLSNYTYVTVPKISLFFSRAAHLDLPITGILYVIDLTQVCLAFAANTDAADVSILGNTQQLTFDVVYDVAASRLGFAPAGCL